MDNNFEKIADMARDVVDVFTKKTDEFLSASKLRIKRTNLNGELKDAYQKLGAAVYEAKSLGVNNDELITLITTEIDEITAAIKKIDMQLEKINNLFKCATCGTVNPKDALYCQHCGSVMPKPEPCCEENKANEDCSCKTEEFADATEEAPDASSENLDEN